MQVSIEVRLLFLISESFIFCINFRKMSGFLDASDCSTDREPVRSTTFFGLVSSWVTVSVAVRSASAL